VRAGNIGSRWVEPFGFMYVRRRVLKAGIWSSSLGRQVLIHGLSGSTCRMISRTYGQKVAPVRLLRSFSCVRLMVTEKRTARLNESQVCETSPKLDS
jgi:hypothetical protein